MFHKVVVVCFFTLLLAVSAQEVEHVPVVKGEVQMDDVARRGHLIVELQGAQNTAPAARVHVNVDGSFEFRDVTAGPYRVRICTENGDPIREDLVMIRKHAEPLILRLPKAKVERPVSGIVSVRQLQSPPPKKAIQAAREAQRHSNAGNNAKAIEKLRLALEIHPDFAEARTNLGVQYIRMRQFESAVTELNEANRLQPGSAIVLANLSYALFSTGQSEKAEDAARRAVELDGNNVNARYLFGFILSMRGSNTRDAISNLKMACDEIPKARLALAQFYARLGNRAAAEEELNRYLAHAKGDEKKQIEGWLKGLKSGFQR